MRIFHEWVLAIALFVALTIDSSLAFYLHQFLNINGIGAGCTIMPIGVMLIALFDDINEKEIWLALGAGIVADISTLGIIGVYAVFLPLICWACQKLARLLPEVFWSRFIVVLIGITLMNIYSWLILNVVGMISIPAPQMLLSLLYNLLWSAIFFVLTYWIWARLATNYPFLVDLDAYRQ